jgi:hypothetical protein
MKAMARGLVIALVGAVLIGLAMVASQVSSVDLGNLVTPRNVIDDGGERVTVPLPVGPPVRLAPAVSVTTSGAYTFLDTTAAGGPVRYDPCRAIGWVLATEGMPERAEQLVHDAFADVQSRTGLVFEYEGVTDEVASFDRSLFQDRYGERFAPVVVGWSSASASPVLSGEVAGIGGSSSVPGAYGEQRYLASGVLLMDAEDVAPLLDDPQSRAVVRAVIMHELGHVVGLGHVDDPAELMHHDNVSLTSWGPGDLAGLAIAGAGPCQEV